MRAHSRPDVGVVAAAITIIAAVALAGCGDHGGSAATATATASVAASSLPVPADFEEQAAARIDTGGYAAELETLEAEVK